MFVWSYGDSARQTIGTMICVQCKRDVAGEFRYRRSKAGNYVVEHRQCSADDATWAQLDQQAKALHAHYTTKLQAYREFRDKWHEHALNSTIDELERLVQAGVDSSHLL